MSKRTLQRYRSEGKLPFPLALRGKAFGFIIFTTIAIESGTDKLIEKLCKRYSLKKGEIVKLAFGYIDKAHINPADAPESVKS